MEEEKAAAYYDELTRKGSGAARFKQGLGFSSPSSNGGFDRAAPASLFGNFVRASDPSVESEIQKQKRIEGIQNKLKKRPVPTHSSYANEDAGEGRNRRRSRSRSRSRERKRSSSGRHSHGWRRIEDDEGSYRHDRRRSRSRSGSAERRSRRINRIDDRESASSRRDKGRGDKGSRPDRSYRERHGEKIDGQKDVSRGGDGSKNKNARTDYSQLIDGYSQMTPAERVKAKMKLQLSQTADKDMSKGATTGWERFDFDKDAPLDDEEIEVAEDDVSLVKDIGQSFRLTAVESKRDEEIKAAHDQAMFGLPSIPVLEIPRAEVNEENENSTQVNDPPLISEKAMIKSLNSCDLWALTLDVDFGR